MADDDAPLDLARVQACATRLLAAIRPELARVPLGNDNVFTALNALAVPVGMVIAGTRFDPAAIEFFRRALARQVSAQDIPPENTPAWLSLTDPADQSREPDAEWRDDPEGGAHLVLNRVYYADPTRVFNALLLTDADIDEATVAGWSDAERRAAAEWALSVHFSASDNDEVIVPPRPAFIPERTWGAAHG